jgi:hypothetical protein
MLVDSPLQHAAATCRPSSRRRQRRRPSAAGSSAPQVSGDRRLAGTNENPVLIAVLAAFIGERMTLCRTIGLLRASPGSAGGHRGR